jgi:hypothetical protein
MNFRSRKRLGISWQAERLLASEEGLCFVEPVEVGFSERIFGTHTILEISWVDKRPLTSQEGLCYLKLFKLASYEHGNEPSGSVKGKEFID